MDLSPYLESLQRDLAAAAAPGGPDVARTAQMLSAALDSTARLSLIEVLADAAAEITTKLDGPSVEVRLRGRDADLVVTQVVAAEPPPPVAEGGDLTRLTVRLPEQLKEAIEQAAAAENISVNAWLVRAAAHAVQGGAAPRHSGSLGRTVTGFAQA